MAKWERIYMCLSSRPSRLSAPHKGQVLMTLHGLAVHATLLRPSPARLFSASILRTCRSEIHPPLRVLASAHEQTELKIEWKLS